MNDIDNLVRAIDPAPRAPDHSPGARELRAAILAEDRGAPIAATRHAGRSGPRRLLLGLTAAAVLATGIVVGPSLLEDGSGVTPSYAVTKDSNGIVYVTVRDFSDAAGLRRQLRDLGVPAIVDHAPHGQKCQEPRGTYVEQIPAGLYSVPENIPGEARGPGWRMRIDTKLFRPGQTFVWTITDSPGGSSTSTILMTGPVAPCVLVPDDTRGKVETNPPYRVATLKDRTLAGLRVDEKTVGEVLPELEKRGLKVKFLIMGIAPGNPGGYGELRTQDTPVGDDWIVWEAEESTREDGVIRLLVTDKRYDRNPVYGGPRDDIIKE
ncbi:hypothetical protein [Nonomuraea sp. NPDC048916]|uniref:hypothetical protein n=1 Tax=Nonomuraea sp. NPDC048916 TaxID=3154232 RepID=UPI0033E566B1